ncbi:uncharacterized protein LOC123874990 isoform X2 [Maniola jurtina]|uniref:uncharacterized protein LOC123874990 isoform X2 n=1 Tax=Maniola jurtina TaxID=191418 RepID=UPI001E68FCEF|nr:uncharacterized protein LOC123874990 isoform X2 [Maniola jurtina]
MYQHMLLGLIFVIMCNSTDTLFIDTKDVGREKNFEEGYFYMIRSTHALKKRDVYSIDTVPVPAGGSRDETIIVTNSGPNYPYSSYYPTNPYSRYPSGANSGTTVIVSNPDGNYNRGYGTKYIPTNTYG